MIRLTILLPLVLAFASCAEYGGPNSSTSSSGDTHDAGPDTTDAGPDTCPIPEECEECETCEDPVECEVCEICEICEPPPVSDPCECFNECPGFDTQKCLSDILRYQGMCTNTPGQHYDVRFWCKIDGEWQSEKTWVYPCDETPWYDR